MKEKEGNVMKNITGRLLIYLLTYLLLLNHAPVKAAADNPKGGEPPKFSETAFGRVTVGKPKIWKFDRIYSTLDGLLRDIDAVQLASLTALDASKTNQTTLDFLSSSFNVSETNPSSPPKSNRTPSALGGLKEENSYLLSPPPPQPTPTPKTQERNIRGSKQNTVN
jgi:hypothetical protein